MPNKKLKMTTYSRKLSPRFIYYVSLILLLSGAACQEENQLKTVVQPLPKANNESAVEVSQEKEKQKQEKGETEVTTEEVVAILLEIVAQCLQGTKKEEEVMSMFIGTKNEIKKEEEKIVLLGRLKKKLGSSSFKQGKEICIALKEIEAGIAQTEDTLLLEKASAEKNATIYLKVSEALAALIASDLPVALEKAKEAEALLEAGEKTQVETKEVEKKPVSALSGLKFPPGLSPKSGVLPPATSGRTEEVISFVGTGEKPPAVEPDLSQVAISVKRVFFDRYQHLVCVLDLVEKDKNLKDIHVDVKKLSLNAHLYHRENCLLKKIIFELAQNTTGRVRGMDKNDFFFVLSLEDENLKKAFSQPSLSLRDIQLIGNNETRSNAIDIVGIDEHATLPQPQEGSIFTTLTKGDTTNSYNIQVSSEALIDASELKFYSVHSPQKQTSYIKIVKNVFSFRWIGNKKQKENKIQTVIEQSEHEQGDGQLDISYARLFKDVVYNVPFSLPDNHNITGIKVEYEDESGRVISNTYPL